MKLWKKWISFHPIMWILCLSIMVVLVGCNQSKRFSIIEGKQNVITSFYPIAFMVEQIGGRHVNTIPFIPAGVDPHDWTPKSRDLHDATNAQLLLINGAGFETWLDDFLKGLDSTAKVKIVEVSKSVPLIATGKHAHHSSRLANEAGDQEFQNPSIGQTSIDPHTWVSPKSALIMASNVKAALIQVDERHRSEYEANYEKLKLKIEAIDKCYTDKLATVSQREIVVSHPAFGYLCRDYGLTQHAIMGMTAGAEPRAQDLVKLSQLVEKKKLKYVFFEERASDQFANTLASETGVGTLALHSLESLLEQQAEIGDHYLTLMERNLENLLMALQ